MSAELRASKLWLQILPFLTIPSVRERRVFLEFLDRWREPGPGR
jgi:hypothetical protein